MTTSLTTLLLATLLVRADAPADLDGPHAVLIDGTVMALKAPYFAEGWKLVGTDGSNEKIVDARDVLEIDWTKTRPNPSPKSATVLLASGEQLFGTIEEATEDDLVLQSTLFGRVQIPLSVVQGILFPTGVTNRTRDSWIRRIRSLPRTADALLLANEDLLVGTLTAFGPERWTIDRDGNARTVDASLLRGAALDPNLIDYEIPKELRGWVRLSDGSEILAQSLQANEGGVSIETFFGPTIQVPMSGLIRIDVRGGRVIYLSDLEPTEIVVQPYLDDPLGPMMDRSAVGTPLEVASQTFEKGIGVRSYCSIQYTTDGYERFQSLVGLDREAGEQASVVCRVLLDDEVAWDSGEITRRSDPVAVDVAIESAQTITLVVEYARRGDVDDLTDWCDARFVLPPE